MSLGAGFSRAGSSPAGFGTPSTAPAPLTVPLPDPSTGLSRSCRLIQWDTGDYVVTNDGRIAGMGTAQQLVLLAIANATKQFAQIQNKGSSDAQFQRKVATVVNNVLAPIIKAGVIQFIRLDVQTAPGHPDGSAINIVWRDLTATAPTVAGNGGVTPTEYRTPIPVT